VSESGRSGARSSRRTWTAVRVTEREFEQLKHKSEAEGARSISDFARRALCGSGGGSTDRVDEGINRLSDDMQQLSADVRRVTELLEASAGSSSLQPNAITARKMGGA
jgi:hypothetical protein